jgi:xanthine dehydrogenase YagS FAD-binding subunit
MIPRFELFQPPDLTSALALLDRFGERAWPLAGGYDSLDWFKDRVKEPAAIIDLEGIDELRGIRENGGAIEIGALTTLTDVERHDKLRRDFTLIADAARWVASPQIRNAATLGGNLCQDARCWYYRQGLACYRAGGNVCYADTPQGLNREHCLFGASRCVAVTPSDTAPALVALDASIVIKSARGERVVSAEDFFMRPSVDIKRMTVLEPGQLLTEVRIPLREGRGPQYLGLRPGERGRGDEDGWRADPGCACCLWRRSVHAAAPSAGRGVLDGPPARRRVGGPGGSACG